MASYGKIYQFHVESINGADIVIVLLKKGYSGVMQKRALGRSPLLRQDSSGCVQGTSLEIYAEAAVDAEYAEMYTSLADEYRAEVYKNNSLIWVGFVTPELYSEPDLAPPYDVQIVATDGLGELKNYTFGKAGIDSLDEHLSYILSHTGLSLEYMMTSQLSYIDSNGITVSGIDLLKMRVDLSHLHSESCYDALQLILSSINARITQRDGKWFIYRETDMVGLATESGLYTQTSNGNSRYLNIAGFGSLERCSWWPVGNLSSVVEPAKNRIEVTSENHYKNNILNSRGWETANTAYYSEPDGAYILPAAAGSIKQRINFDTEFSNRLLLSVKARNVGSGDEDQALGVEVSIYGRTYQGRKQYWLIQPAESDRGVAAYIWRDREAAIEADLDVPSDSDTEGDAQDIEIILPLYSKDSRSYVYAEWVEVRLFSPTGPHDIYVYDCSLSLYDRRKGWQTSAKIDNVAREEAKSVDVTFTDAQTAPVSADEVMTGIPLDIYDEIVKMWKVGNQDPADYLSVITRDNAMAVALPRIKYTGILNVPNGNIPYLFLRDERLYSIESYSYDLINDELEIELLGIPVADIEITQSTNPIESGSSSSGTSPGSGSSGGTGSGGSSSLAGLQDVSLTNLAEGQLLIREGNKWVNRTIQEYLDKYNSLGDWFIKIDNVLLTKYNLASEKEVSAKGISQGSGGEGSGSSYPRLDTWDGYDSNKAGYALSAGLGYGLKVAIDELKGYNLDSRVSTIENSYISKDAGGVINGGLTVSSLAIAGGTSSQFLKADGSLDGTSYLSAAGGSLYGELWICKEDQAEIYFAKNSAPQALVGWRSNIGTWLYDYVYSNYISITETAATFNGYPLWHSGNFNPADYLPLSGGTIKKADNAPLFIEGNLGSSWVGIGFKNDNGIQGFIGVFNETPVFFNSVLAYYNILHDGNIGAYALKTDGSNIMTDGIKWTLDQTPSSWDSYFDVGGNRGLRILNNVGHSTEGAPSNYAVALVVSGYYGFALAYDANGSTFKAKGYDSTDWKQIAFTDSNLLTSLGYRYTTYSDDEKFIILGLDTAKYGYTTYIDGHNIELRSNGTSMLINSSGNVGIGNIDPQYNLDVNGDIRATESITIGGATLSWENGALKVNTSFYSEKEISAKGLSTGGGSGASYNRLDAWGDYDSSKAGYVLSAYLGDDLNTRLSSLSGVVDTHTSRLSSLENAGYITSSALSGYLPLSGGTISGNLAVDGYIINKGHYIGVNDDDNAVWYVTDKNWQNTYTLLHSGNYSNFALPLRGGVITGDPALLTFRVPRIGADAWLQFTDTETSDIYAIGIRRPANMFGLQYKINNDNYDILHSGNIASYAMRYYGTNMPSNIVNFVGYGKPAEGWDNFGPAISFGYGAYYAQMQMASDGSICSRISWEGSNSDWKTIAFTDSNVAGAQKLVDGSGNPIIHNSGATFYIGDTIYPTIPTNILGSEIVLKYGASATNGLILDSSGNVTIGNGYFAGSGIKLYVDGTARFSAISDTSAINHYDSGKGYYVGLRNSGLGVTTGGLLLYTYGATPMSFYTDGGERMHITASGNVGIGTADPQYKLDVYGQTRILKDNYGVLIGYDGNTIDGAYAYGFSQLRLNFCSSSHISLCYGGGNVGVGTYDPSYRLHVEGTGYFSGALTANGGLTVNGGFAANEGITTTSFVAATITANTSASIAALTVSGLSTLTGGIATNDIHGNGQSLYLGNASNNAYIKVREDMVGSSSMWSIPRDGRATFTSLTTPTLSVTGNATIASVTIEAGTATLRNLTVNTLATLKQLVVGIDGMSCNGPATFNDFIYSSSITPKNDNYYVLGNNNYKWYGVTAYNVNVHEAITIEAGKELRFKDDDGVVHTLKYDSSKQAFVFDGNVNATGEMSAKKLNA